MSDPFTNAVRSTVLKHQMLRAGELVLAAVSGGADSLALLHALCGLRADLGISVAASHVDHAIRGDDSALDAEFVRAEADRLGVAFYLTRADAPAASSRTHRSLETAARDVRIRCLTRMAHSCGAARIATGHTGDDRVETVILNLARGSGVDGLAGFEPINGPFIRPLYDLRRADTVRFCEDRGLDYRTDASNSDTGFRRNRIRLEILPLLREYVNPRVEDAILRMANLCADESNALEMLARAHLLAWGWPEPTRELPVLEFDTLPLALRRRVLRSAILQVRGTLADVSSAQVERIAGPSESQPATIALPTAQSGDFRITRTANSIAIKCLQARLSAVPARVEVPQSGSVHLSTGTITASHFASAKLALDGALTVRPGHAAVVINAGSFSAPLFLRTWIAGDRIELAGMSGRKKLQDLFTDLKVARSERGLMSLLADNEGRIIAAGSLRCGVGATFLRNEMPTPVGIGWSGATTLVEYPVRCGRETSVVE